MLDRRVLIKRRALAVALVLGFYVTMLAVVALLGAIAAALIGVFPPPLDVLLAGSVALTAIGVLYMIAPGKAPPPAPRRGIVPVAHGGLDTFVRAVVADAGCAALGQVLLSLEPRAWAGTPTRRERRAGRVTEVGVGLPELALLDQAELRALILHEAFHLRARDPWTAEWLAHGRRALARAGSRMVVARPALALVEAYERAFERAVNPMNREDELAADAFAARSAGADVVAGMLRRVTLSEGFWAYWEAHVVPALDAGERPAIAEGFRAFAGEEGGHELLLRLRREHVAHSTHPATEGRIHRLGGETLGRPGPAAEPALALLDDVPGAEAALLDSLDEPATRDSPAPWRPVDGEIRLALAKGGSGLLRFNGDQLFAGAVFLATLAVFGASVWAATLPGLTATGKTILVIAASALLVYVMIRLVVELRVRRAHELVLRPEGLVVDYPSVLREPLVVPRSALSVAAVDGGANDPPGFTGPRFPIADPRPWRLPGASSPDWGHMWGPLAERSILPVLCGDATAPNVLLAFEAPRRYPATVRDLPLRPVQTRDLRGVLLVARDEAAAREAFSRWAMLGDVTPAVAEVLTGRKPEHAEPAWA